MFRILLICVIIISLVSSCKSKKGLFGGKSENLAMNAFLDSCNTHKLDFETFSSKIRVSFDNGKKSQTVGGNLKILKDSLIWISISPGMGIELARMVISKDSVKLLDRLNKRYFVGDFTFLEAKSGVEIDFATIHSILTNGVFIYPQNAGIGFRDDFTLKMDTNKFVLENDKESDRMKQLSIQSVYDVVPGTYRPDRIKIRQLAENKGIDLKYSDFTDKSGFNIAEDIDLVMRKNEKEVKLSIKYLKYNFNKTASFNFKIPKGYSELKL